ncbi:MAG: hypothetical protein NTW28_16430, partial [Candidatus Solibacter sp.]|nr:hypothetical protein [Candidatus Solibacter sp.]
MGGIQNRQGLGLQNVGSSECPEFGNMCRPGWKWRKRSSVKITERAREEIKKALHRPRESRHFEATFAGA